MLKGHEPEREQQVKLLQKSSMNKGCIIETKLSQIWHIAFLIYLSPKICQDTCWIYQGIVPECHCLSKELSAHHHHPGHSTPASSASSRIHRIISLPDICQIRFPMISKHLRAGMFNEFRSAVIHFGRSPGGARSLAMPTVSVAPCETSLQRGAQAGWFLVGGW